MDYKWFCWVRWYVLVVVFLIYIYVFWVLIFWLNCFGGMSWVWKEKGVDFIVCGGVSLVDSCYVVNDRNFVIIYKCNIV